MSSEQSAEQTNPLQLREMIDAYLRECQDWLEHPDHAGTYMQWEDCRASPPDAMFLPTDLAAARQMVREARS